MRDWKNTPTEVITRKILAHGYLMASYNMPLDLEDDDYYSSLLAEIQKRINDSYNNGYRTGYKKGFDDSFDYFHEELEK